MSTPTLEFGEKTIADVKLVFNKVRNITVTGKASTHLPSILLKFVFILISI